MIYDWDPAKNVSNRAKHGIGFPEAIRVFLDPNLRELYVSWPEDQEDRWAVLGRIGEDVFYVCYTDRDHNVRRIISARRASRDERRRYHQRNDLVR